jgi:LDH2 family malate/lactate/ureidoglycolate dehydrogenase
LPSDDAATVAALMVDADMQGSDGHGVIRLAPYAKRILAGGINLKPEIKVVQERTAMALMDGDNGMGHLVMKKATELAIYKARSAGIAWVGSRLSNHAGPVCTLQLATPIICHPGEVWTCYCQPTLLRRPFPL